MKLFSKEKMSDGRRNIYLFGFKLLSYRKKSQSNLQPSIYDEYKIKFSNANWKLSKDNKYYYISKDNFKVCGVADNTLWTAYGVFCKDEYNFKSKDEYIMIDIGLNLGFTSLRFAQKSNIKKIYGYEPFKQTYELATKNLELNPKLAEKIKIFNFGLSDNNKIINIHYNSNLPGSMSTVVDRFEESTEECKVELKNVADILKPIFEKHNEKIFVKIDCEGAEKEILPCLEQFNLLNSIDFIIMEWHFESPNYLIDILVRNNFLVSCRHDIIDDLGTIIAFRNK